MPNNLVKKLEIYCKKNGVKITGQRKIITKIIAGSSDHPDVEQIYERAKKQDDNISIATTYRNIKFLEEANIIEKHDFGDGKARYEPKDDDHHDHIINIDTGEIIEFHDEKLEKMKEKIALDLGFKLLDHRLELYVVPKEKK